ncbi:hypothetical protein AVEN_219929-1 [Araneus ventricosus]|uniref:Uncharacterized protein n=1 Tax=Araneus ventricosus TaxID=182803 RepID=A0A4Y2TIA3_ARAVE|nr:hypothetical protein AVEN_219929-1 [Araneus ventricosus]
MAESYKLNPPSKSMDGNSYEDIVTILSSFPTDVIDKICSKAKMLRESFDPAQSSFPFDSDAEADLVMNDFVDDVNLHNSNENEICLPDNKSLDNSKEASNTSSEEIHSDEGEIVEEIQEDVSELEALYLEMQQSAFQDFIRPNFALTRLPTNAYCREWLLKHAECCLTDSIFDHTGIKMDLQKPNENEFRGVSESAEQRIFDNSQESSEKGKDEIVFDEGLTSENILDDAYTVKEDSVQNSSPNDTDLQSSSANDKPLPISESFDNSHVTSNIVGDEVETVEIVQEDTSALQTLYQENQNVSLDEIVRPKRRSPKKACRKWLSKHVFCCLRGSVLEHSDDKRDEKDIRRISEFAKQPIIDNSHESRNKGSDDVVSSIRKSPNNTCRKWLLNHVLCCLKN